MATLTAPALGRATPPLESTLAATGCDHSECPATGTHRVEAHGQDFYFCGHHWRELAPLLTTLETPQPQAQPPVPAPRTPVGVGR